jgi:hypothetical protein
VKSYNNSFFTKDKETESPHPPNEPIYSHNSGFPLKDSPSKIVELMKKSIL